MSKNYVTTFRGETYFTPNGKYIKQEPVTPQEDFGDHNNLENSLNDDFGSMKKSLSMSDINALRRDLIKLEMQDREEVYHRYRQPTGVHQELSKTKFVSMAEAIYHFQRDTPSRFRSSRPTIFQPQNHTSLTGGLTVPQSPMLRCKTRSRPTHVMSQKEIEELELEEIKKHKIKANPIPKSVLQGPIHLPEVPKKPATVAVPFNITEIPKKLPKSPVNQQPTFKAKPAPKHIFQKPQEIHKPSVKLTKPISPKIHYKKPHTEPPKEKPSSRPSSVRPKVGPIQSEPFSFLKRDEDMKRKKEEKIKKIIEEEKKQANLFKAQPLPGAVKKRMMNTTIKGSSSNASSENKENHRFEARPPTVLYKEPFKPVLKPLQIAKPEPFDLTTQKRAAERERFEKLLKEKEQEQEKLRQLREKEICVLEEKAIAKLRAQLVHHAKPIPVIKSFIPEKSAAPLTMPETPKFVRKLKHN